MNEFITVEGGYPYFSCPVQVAYWDEECYCSGIAYKDMVICGCCGAVVEICDICDNVPAGIKPIVVYDNWLDLNGFMLGDEENFFELEGDAE